MSETLAMFDPLPALHTAFDELAEKRSSFHVVAGVAAGAVHGWTVVKGRAHGFDAESGCFVAPSKGHYLFMASADAGVWLAMRHNGERVAHPLDATTPLLVAALRLVRGDVITLDADAATEGAVCWRGART